MKTTKTISAGSWFEAREKAKRTFRNFALDYARKQGIRSLGGGQYKVYLKHRESKRFAKGSAYAMAAKLNKLSKLAGENAAKKVKAKAKRTRENRYEPAAPKASFMAGTSKSYVTQTTSLYLTAAELARRGFVVAATSRDAPGVDLMAQSPDMKRSYGIQVKGNHWEGTQSYWLTGKRARTDSGPGLLYVFVNLKPDGARPDFYVVPSKVVTKRMWEERRKGSEWYGFDRDEDFKEKWDLLE